VRKIQRRVRTMTPEEAAWLGAFIDAEGWVGQMHTPSGDYWRITIGSTEPEYLSAFYRITGVGTVSTQKPRLGSKLFIAWSINATKGVEAIARQCAPYSLKVRKVLNDQ